MKILVNRLRQNELGSGKQWHASCFSKRQGGEEMLYVSKIGKNQLGAFVKFPFSLYSPEEPWFPRAAAEVSSWFTGTHPCSPCIDFIPFMAFRDGQPVGRCAAFVNRMAQIEGHPLGCIGQYECEDSGETSAAMIEAAMASLKSSGCRVAWGPMDGSIWTSYRFMTAGFEGPSFYGEPRNKRWYPAQFAAAGFEPVKTWSSFFLRRARHRTDHRERGASPTQSDGIGLHHPPSRPAPAR